MTSVSTKNSLISVWIVTRELGDYLLKNLCLQFVEYWPISKTSTYF